MEILFLGVGEACDENYPNTSMIVSDEKGVVLIDCGFSTPHQFFKFITDPDVLDIIWISHFHGDHFLGIPLLLLRFWETGRTKPLYFIAQKGIKDMVKSIMELAYPSFIKKLQFELIFMELDPLKPISVLEFTFTGAFSIHSQKNMALKLECTSHSIYYSGDGKPSDECFSLANGCDIIVHECFLIKGDLETHGSVELSIDFAHSCGVNKMAIVHMQRDERKGFNLKNIDSKGLTLLTPIPGDKIIL